MEEILASTKLNTDLNVLASAIAEDLLSGDRKDRGKRIEKLKDILSMKAVSHGWIILPMVLSSSDYIDAKMRYSETR